MTPHDRWFLDRDATHILSYEDDSASGDFFEGNYTEYEADRKSAPAEAAAQPHRVRHKKSGLIRVGGMEKRSLRLRFFCLGFFSGVPR